MAYYKKNRLRELTNLIYRFPGENLQGTTHLKFSEPRNRMGKVKFVWGKSFPQFLTPQNSIRAALGPRINSTGA